MNTPAVEGMVERECREVSGMVAKARNFSTSVLMALMGVALSSIGIQDARAAQFSLKSLNGSYGCSGTVGAEFTGVARLTADGKGNFTSGSFTVDDEGESCTYALVPGNGSVYTLNADGTGIAHTTWTVGASQMDNDNDVLCSTIQGQTFTGITPFIVEAKASRVEFAGSDPERTGSSFTATDDDSSPFFGSCNKQ